MPAIVETAFEKAREILTCECSPIGLMASPMGYPHQAWSAGMYAFAYHCVRDGHLPRFDRDEW
jgi:hypothetical protein